MITLEIKYNIAGYCRISVDEEMDRDNTSIENQKAIIADFVKHKFPTATLDFYEDRDRSGYTFEQREGYQELRKKMMALDYDILIVKDFSRFSRRNSKGLVELEDLRDAGIRIIAIGDNIDYPTYDDWTAIQFRFLINEMPVTDTSKKVKSVIKRRQEEGKWICSVPFGYVITNTKSMTFEIDEAAADIVRMIFKLYNDGWGYKKIANHLTDLNIPTPRMTEKIRKEANGEEYRQEVKTKWSIVTVSDILKNDFYIGTLRQGKYKRKRINGNDVKNDKSDHIIFENNHTPILDYRIFAITQEQLKIRSNTNYRGIKKYDNIYSGFIYCGDCGSPMFALSRPELAPAYTCGTYHSRGTKGCTSHHTRVDLLDDLLKSYIRKVKENSADMLDKINQSLKEESEVVKENATTLDILKTQIDDAKSEIKILAKQKARDILKNPDKQDILEETYDEMIEELTDRIDGLNNQIQITSDRRNTIIRVNRIAKTAIDIFDDILNKEKLDKGDVELIIEKILIYTDRIEIKLKTDIDSIIKTGTIEDTAVNFNLGTQIISQKSRNHKPKDLCVNVISSGDPLEIYTDHEGEVIFKKYSPIGELTGFALQYAETLHKTCELSIVICDRDTIIACSGLPRKEYADKRLSGDIEKIIESRNMYQFKDGEKRLFPVDDGQENHHISCAMPIITEGDIIGCVSSLITTAGRTVSEDLESKLIMTAANFLSKQLES